MNTLSPRWLNCMNLCLVLGLLLFAVAVQPAQADVGPKPSMSFEFEYEIEPVEIISAQLLECDLEDCSDAAPLEELGPQGIYCNEGSCDATAYGFADYHQLVVEFEDRTRTSNVFTSKEFSTSYNVTVYADRLEVEISKLKSLSPMNCLSGLGFTLAIEMLLATLLLGVLRLPRTLLGWVPLASLATLPAVWGLFPALGLPAGLTTALAETFAVGAEAAIYYFASGRQVGPARALLLSLVLNAASFGAGWFV